MGSYVEYEDAILRALWTWADQYHRGDLDGGNGLCLQPDSCYGFEP